jgi:hypothetical protein
MSEQSAVPLTCAAIVGNGRRCCRPAKFVGTGRAYGKEMPLCGVHANVARRTSFGHARRIEVKA